MGNGPSVGALFAGSASNEQVDALARDTGLTHAQLTAMARSFKKQHPNGLTRADWAGTLTAGGIASPVLHEAFWRVVSAGREVLSLADFSHAVSLVQRGDSARRLALAFDVCSTPAGVITRAHLLEVMRAIHALVGQLVAHSGRVYATPEEFVAAFFDELGTDVVTRAAFEEHAYKSLDVISALGLYGSNPIVVDNSLISFP